MDGAELWGVALLAAFFFVVSAGPLAVSMVVTPEAIDRGDVHLSPPCPTRARTGVGCPTCGLTRGFAAMSRFRVGDALRYNAAAPWLYLGAWALALSAAGVVLRIGEEWRGRGVTPRLRP